MPVARFRIKDPSTGLFFRDGRRIVRTLPVGSVIKVDHTILDGDQLVDVLWENEKVLMFTQDIRARAEREP
ncbi:MAG TPA: hypothetical protein VIX89_18425 [Bryobacteraceae bacterium]